MGEGFENFVSDEDDTHYLPQQPNVKMNFKGHMVNNEGFLPITEEDEMQ